MYNCTQRTVSFAMRLEGAKYATGVSSCTKGGNERGRNRGEPPGERSVPASKLG
jgi:hypothetical protein